MADGKSLNVLVINCGSSSLKFAILDAGNGDTLLSGSAERLLQGDSVANYRLADGEQQHHTLGSNATHEQTLAALVGFIRTQGLDQTLVAVGHRVVHGGEQFSESVRVSDKVLQRIREVTHLAPLHNPANIAGIEAAIAAFPALPQVAVFDTAFHHSLPRHAYLYALPMSLYREHGVRRYGMHGTSHRYVAERALAFLELQPPHSRLITAHLGNGASMAAILDGHSIDTSMGLTPLEGLVMGTRTGDLDPSISHYLVSQLGYSIAQVDDLYNKHSGLLGISELSNDVRSLEEAEQDGHAGARLALDIFCYRLAKYVGAYTVVLGGVDALVLTGGVGENSARVRASLLNRLAGLGYQLDSQANQTIRFGLEGPISLPGSATTLVIPTNEEWMIARDAARLAQEFDV